MAKSVSEVEDGFALKRRRDMADKAKSKRKKRAPGTGYLRHVSGGTDARRSGT